MAHVRFSPGSSTLRRTLVLGFVASLLPLATAFAQSGPRVRVTAEATEILTFQHATDDVLMTADPGTVLEVIHTEGDKYRHRDSNWYWVLVPRDAWGTQRSGWVLGRYVESIPAEPRAAVSPAVQIQQPQPVEREPNTTADVAVDAPPIPVPTVDAPEPFEVVLNFAFAKSDLSDEAKSKLAEAVAMLKGSTAGIAFALEGHADATGPEAFNEKLGLARAETVRRYLAEQHEIPVDQISVVSAGENEPVATNATREGRAQNRRVLVKVGASL